MEHQLPMKWIKVEDFLPNINQKVISFNGDYIAITFLETHDSKHLENGRYWWNLLSSGCGCCDTDMKNVTHWMPIPENPE